MMTLETARTLVLGLRAGDRPSDRERTALAMVRVGVVAGRRLSAEALSLTKARFCSPGRAFPSYDGTLAEEER